MDLLPDRNIKSMQNTEIVYPKSVEEQGKIGNYFQSIDHLITLHQRESIFAFINNKV